MYFISDTAKDDEEHTTGQNECLSDNDTGKKKGRGAHHPQASRVLLN